jgi:hypothetical protein
MARYRVRPVGVDAVRWDGSRRGEEEIMLWARQSVRGSATGRHLTVVTSKGRFRAHPGDWIVHGPNGQWSVVRDELFTETYEPATD